MKAEWKRPTYTEREVPGSDDKTKLQLVERIRREISV